MDVNITNTNKEANNAAERILPNFKDMKKKTMGETYKYLNLLLKGKSASDFKNVTELVSPTTPLPMFEESLRLIVIDSLHLENEVLKILLNQDDYQIKRILKCKWFFQKPSAKYYKMHVFTNISASVRHKIVSQLSKHMTNKNEAEEMFEFLQHKYSVRLAEKLLPHCSEAFILNYIHKVKKLFGQSCRIILNISKKYPELGMQMMSNLFEMNLIDNCYDYKKVFQYLAAHQTVSFIPFVMKHHSKIRIKGLFQIKLKECPLKPHEMMFSKVFNTEFLFRNLSYDNKVKFLSGLVTRTDETFLDWEACADNITSLLHLVPPNKRLKMISTVFNQVYNVNFNDHPEAWSLEMLELIPNNQRRFFVQKLDEAVKERSNLPNIEYMLSEPETYIYLYDFSIAFDKFKKIISKIASPYRRQAVLIRMVECCSINRDLVGLEKLAEYVRTSQRNNDPRILSEFLCTVVKSFPNTDFNLPTWVKLQEIAQICALKNQMEAYGDITERHILHRLEIKANVEPYYKSFFELYVLKCVNSRSFLESCKSEHSRVLYFAICREILAWIRAFPSEINTAENLLRNILKTCEKFNKLNKGKVIRLEEVPSLKEELHNQAVKRFGDIGGGEWSMDIWNKFYAILLDPNAKTTILRFILKKNMGINAKNVEAVANYLVSDPIGKAEECVVASKKAFSFMGISDKICDLFLKEFKKGKSVLKKKKFLSLYSHVCTVEEFREAILEYLPKAEKISSDTDSRFLQIQLSIPDLLRNLRPRRKNLNLISEFFIGDFLISALPSFHACVCYTQADAASAFVKECLSKFPFRVTFTKSVIRLIVEVSTRRETIDFCLLCWKNNPHPSIRAVLMTFISKHFLELPTEEGFQALEKCILESDDLIIQGRPKIDARFPREFLMDYVNTLWKFSEKLPPKHGASLQAEVLARFNRKNIRFLKNEFSKKLIEDNLFKPTLLNVEEFTVNYLVSDSKEVQTRTKMLLEMLKSAGVDSDLVSSFLKTLAKISMQDSTTYAGVLDFVLVNWPPYPPYVLYEERLMLTYHNLYHKIVVDLENVQEKFQHISVEFGKELKNYYSGLSHVSAVTIILVESLNNFFRELRSNNRTLDVVLVSKELVRDSKNRSLAIVGISVVPDDVVRFYNEEDTFDFSKMMRKKDLNEFIQLLKGFDDQVLLIYLSKKFGLKALEKTQ